MAVAKASSTDSIALMTTSDGMPTRAFTPSSKTMSPMVHRPAFSAWRRLTKKRKRAAGSSVPAGIEPCESRLSESLTLPRIFWWSMATTTLSRLAPGSSEAVSSMTRQDGSVSRQSQAAVPQSLTAMEQNEGSNGLKSSIRFSLLRMLIPICRMPFSIRSSMSVRFFSPGESIPSGSHRTSWRQSSALMSSIERITKLMLATLSSEIGLEMVPYMSLWFMVPLLRGMKRSG